MKEYFLDGAAQDIWWIVQDLGYLTYHATQAYAQGKVPGLLEPILCQSARNFYFESCL
jgi:hypothetical protein